MQIRRAALFLTTVAGILFLAALPAAATLSAPAGVTAPAIQDGETVDAKIIDFDFDPEPLRIQAGATVRWTNTGARPHTATDRGGTFDTKPISPGKTATVTFSVPGRYQYFCRINPAKMNSEIIVTAGDEPAKVSRIQALDPAIEGAKLSFDPSKLEVPVGSSVLLANVGGKPHTLTADDGSFDTGVVAPGAEGGRFAGTNATIKLTKSGSFPFHCEIHPAAMKGVLTVTGEDEGGGAGEDAGGEEEAQASNAPAKVTIDMKDFAFDPAEISVAPAGKVTWKNSGQAPHTATFDDIQLDTKTIDGGGDATLTAPSKPGSYSYKCNIHPGQMRAVLVVVGQNVADPTAKKEAVSRDVATAAAATDDGGGDGGGSGAVSWFALTTGVLGAFAAGFGISAFIRGRSDNA